MIDHSDSISFRRIQRTHFHPLSHSVLRTIRECRSERSDVVLFSDTQEVASLQMDLLRLNRVFYHRVRKVKGINSKLGAVEQLPWFSVAEAQRR